MLQFEQEVAVGWHRPHFLVYDHLQTVYRGAELFHGFADLVVAE